MDQNDKSNDEQSLSGSEEESDPEFTLPSYTETSEEWSLSGSAKESGLTLPSLIEMDRDERSLLEERSESTVSSYMELNEDEGDQAKEDGRSEITLPSYTEMCGDEDSLAQRGQNVEEEDIDDEEIIHGSDIIEDSNVAMPGCFGDCMVGNQLPQDIRLPRASSLKNYRYIGKRRPNYDEFETTPESRGGQGYREESRVPPAESTAVDVHIFINK